MHELIKRSIRLAVLSATRIVSAREDRPTIVDQVARSELAVTQSQLLLARVRMGDPSAGSFAEDGQSLITAQTDGFSANGGPGAGRYPDSRRRGERGRL